MNALALTAWLTVAGAPGAAKAMSADEARDLVYAWENNVLAKWPKGQEAQRDQAIRDYFAKLRDPQHKLAAIGATNSRYVYQIPPQLVPELMKPLLADADRAIRIRALQSLAYNHAAGACFDEVVAIFKTSDGDLFDAALRAMGRIRDARALPHLRPLLRHADGMIRAEAVWHLLNRPDANGELRAEVMRLWKDPHPQVRHNLLNAVDLTTPAGEAQIREAARDVTPHVRQRAAERLVQSKVAYADAMLATLMRDENAHVRGRAIEGLATRGVKAHVNAFLAFAQDVKEDLYVRRVSVTALETLGDAKHVVALQALTGDADLQMRERAFSAIRAIQGRSIAP